MIDLGRQTDIDRLYSAIGHSREAMRPFRQNRQRMLEQYVGSYYSDKGARYEVLVNLLNMTAEVYTIGLAANNPRVHVTTGQRELWPFAWRWQQTLNNQIEEIRFNETMQRVILDAFFVGGAVKVFQAEWGPVQLEDDVWADPGRPYVGHISFDDFGLDMTVKDRRRCKFMWDEYRVSWASVQDNPDYDQSVVKLMTPTTKYDRGEQYAQEIGTGALTDDDEYEPQTDLMDVWLPELNAVGVFPRQIQSKPLKLVEAGPEGGPYKFLALADVPDNAMPSSPAQNLLGLHLLYNGLMRKQARQAKRQKTNPLYRPQSEADANRAKRVNDGEWVKVADPKGIDVLQQGGVDQANTAFSLGVLDLFGRQAGNLEAMAGLGPQANTVGQEELIHQAVSRKEAKMQQRVHRFVSDVVGCLGHLMWADEVLQVPSSTPFREGSSVRIDTSWTPELREGDFWQYGFEVEPYSMNYESPEAKLMKLERAMDRLAQLYPIIERNGGSIDVERMQKDYADLLGIPQLENWITYGVPEPPPGMQQQSEGRMAPETTRNYVRRNVATGGTPQNRSSVLQQALLGGGQNTSQQTATMARAAG